MFNMNIKPRLPRIESGAIVEHKETGHKGFVVKDTETNEYRVAMYHSNGSLDILRQGFEETDYSTFFTVYRVLAQRNEYSAKIQEI